MPIIKGLERQVEFEDLGPLCKMSEHQAGLKRIVDWVARQIQVHVQNNSSA